jgi:hypothetical protein
MDCKCSPKFPEARIWEGLLDLRGLWWKLRIKWDFHTENLSSQSSQGIRFSIFVASLSVFSSSPLSDAEISLKHVQESRGELKNFLRSLDQSSIENERLPTSHI